MNLVAPKPISSMITTTKQQRQQSKAQAVTFTAGKYNIPASADQFQSANNPSLIMAWGTSENGRQPLNVGKMPDQCFTDKGAIKACAITVTKAGNYTAEIN